MYEMMQVCCTCKMAMAHVLDSTKGAVMATVMVRARVSMCESEGMHAREVERVRVRARLMCMRWCEGIGEGKGKGRGEGGNGSTCMSGTRARAHV